MKRLSPGLLQSAWLPWIVVILLAASCCVLGALQYRWITEYSAAERDRIRAELQGRLDLLSRSFNDEISSACLALIPEAAEIEKVGREKAYAARYAKLADCADCPGTKAMLFRRIGLAIPLATDGGDSGKSEVLLETLDLQKATPEIQFTGAEWPTEWNALRRSLEARLAHPNDPIDGALEPMRQASRPTTGTSHPLPKHAPIYEAFDPQASTLMAFPRFGELADRRGFREQEWLVVELNEDEIRSVMLPAFIKKYLAEPGGLDPGVLNPGVLNPGVLNYDTEVTLNADSSKVIYPPGGQSTAASIAGSADASVALLSVEFRLRAPPRREEARTPEMRGPGSGQGLRTDSESGREGPPQAFRQPPDERGRGPSRGPEDRDNGRFGRRGPPPDDGRPHGEFGRGPEGRGSGDRDSEARDREGRGQGGPGRGERPVPPPPPPPVHNNRNNNNRHDNRSDNRSDKRDDKQAGGSLQARADGRGAPMRRPPPPRGRSPLGPPPELPHEFAQARWRLFVRHRAGSLEALAASARNRNIAISGGLLLLILAIVGSLLRVSRQSQRLAESHMNFVAGVSHELRTPLTVIRTAAYNLRGKMANRPEQVEKYGKLIQEESEKLGALVEQVLQFASGQAGHVIREREPVAVESLIEDSLRGNIESMETRGIQLEKRIDTGLPPVLADRLAMKHALQNLVDNALKYATGSEPWIGVSASAISTGQGPGIEIRVADRGPGIPAEEQKHIFDPFFRGRRAVSDQVHGTGLGLNLARRIVEAHEGTLEVRSDVQTGAGTEFIVRIPAAPSELSHELAHSIG